MLKRQFLALAALCVMAMAQATPAPMAKFRAFDANGDPLAGGKLFSYVAGTSTPLNTYTTAAASIPNTNPVILDANGEAHVWLGSASYKLVLKDSSDVVQWTVDNIPGGNELTDTIINGTLDVAGVTTLSDDLSVAGNLSVTGSSTFTGALLAAANGVDFGTSSNRFDAFLHAVDIGGTPAISVSKAGDRTAGFVLNPTVTAATARIGHVGAFLGSVTGAANQEIGGYIFFPSITLPSSGTTAAPGYGVGIAAPEYVAGSAKPSIFATLLVESDPASDLCSSECYSLLVDGGTSAFDSKILFRNAGTGIEMNAAGELHINASNAAGTLGFYTAAARRWKMTVPGHLLAETDGLYDIGQTQANRPRSIYAQGRIVAQTITTFAASDTTPSVSAGNLFKTANGSPTTITTFDDAVTGQVITIIFTDANTTISEASNIRLSAAFTSTADDTMSLVYDGTNWFETKRSVN